MYDQILGSTFGHVSSSQVYTWLHMILSLFQPLFSIAYCICRLTEGFGCEETRSLLVVQQGQESSGLHRYIVYTHA